MVAYTKNELKDQVLAVYKEQDLSGGVVDLASEILSNYLYLHQVEDLSIIMEGSFLRSRLLSSRIQHAADNFYSVPRGSSQQIKLSELYMTGNSVDAKEFDFVSSYGRYKLYYASNVYSKSPNEPISFTGYLSTGEKVVYEFKGDGKHYHDIYENNDSTVLATDISEDLIITKSEVVEGEIKTARMVTINSISELYHTQDAATDKDAEPESNEKVCLMTMPNYGLRLWKKSPFKESVTYTVTYLKCPDITIDEWLDSETLLKNIKSVPGYTKGEHFNVENIKARESKVEDLDLIYLYTANKVRFGGSIVSLNSLEELVREYFPEIKGFNIVVGPALSEIATAGSGGFHPNYIYGSNSIDSNTIKVYYTTGVYDTRGIEQQVDRQRVVNFNALAKTYYVTQNIEFELATRIGADTSSGTSDYYYTKKYHHTNDSDYRHLCIKIRYNNVIDYSRCEKIIRDMQNNVGQDFNEYQIIANLMGDSELLGKISLVTVYDEYPIDGSAKEEFSSPYKMNLNVRPYFPDNSLSIIYERE